MTQHTLRRRNRVPDEWRREAAIGALDQLRRSGGRRAPVSDHEGTDSFVRRPDRRRHQDGPESAALDLAGLAYKTQDEPAHPTDVGAVGYGPEDVPVVPSALRDLRVRHEWSGDRDLGFNPVLQAPEPRTVYVVDRRFLFATDSVGRVMYGEGWLGWCTPERTELRRDSEVQRTTGHGDRQPFDQGGHLFAARAGGPGEHINVLSQTATQNQRRRGTTAETNWGHHERSLLRLRLEGRPVFEAVAVDYPDERSQRPTRRTVYVRHDGAADEPRVFAERAAEPVVPPPSSAPPAAVEPGPDPATHAARCALMDVAAAAARSRTDSRPSADRRPRTRAGHASDTRQQHER